MRRVLAVAAKDLTQTRRDRLAALFMLIMPIAFTAFLGVIIGSGEQRYPLAVADRDGDGQASRLVRLLRDSRVVEVRMVASEELDEEVDDQRTVAGLVIPEGFSDAVASGRRAQLMVVRDAGAAAGQSAVQEVSAAAAQLVAERRVTEAAVIAVQMTAHGTAHPLSGADTSEIVTHVRAALAALGAGGDGAAPGTTAARITQAGGEEATVPSGFELTSPGMIVNFILFGLTTAGIGLIQERRTGTLQRLRTTRLRRSELIGGKVMGMFALTFIQQILLIAAGALAFGVDYFAAPGALLLVMIGLSVLVSCLGLLLASLLGSEQALVAASVMVSMAWSAMSGAWFPLEITGPTFSAVGHMLPTAWILDAFRGISLKGWGVAEVLPAVGVAFAWAAAFFGLGVWRVRSSQ